MIPVLYPSTETAFTTNGLGGLPDAISCVVTEQRNTQGGYYLEMEYPIDGLHYDLLAPERIIYAAPSMGNTPQPFRISRITRPINGIVHIEAPHISAQLQKITTSGTFTARSFTGITYDFAEAARDLGQTFPFWFSSDKTFTETQISFPEPTPFANVLLGAEGSILDTFGGEYEWNGREVNFTESYIRLQDSDLDLATALDNALNPLFGTMMVPVFCKDKFKSPRNINIPASVVTKAGTPTLVTRSP